MPTIERRAIVWNVRRTDGGQAAAARNPTMPRVGPKLHDQQEPAAVSFSGLILIESSSCDLLDLE